MIFLKSIEKKRKKRKNFLCTCKKKFKSKKTIHTVLNAEQIILSEYNCCAVTNKSCVQTAEYILCVYCTVSVVRMTVYLVSIVLGSRHTE